MIGALRNPLKTALERWFERREGDTTGATRLHYRRVYILPTRAGMTYAALLLALWVGGVNYSNNLIFLFTFLLTGLFLAAMHHAFFNLVALRVVPGAAAPVFAGQIASFTLHLESDRRRPRFAIEAASAEGVTPPPATDVHPDDGARIVVSRRATHRGRLRPGRVTLATRYPMGLFRAWAHVRPDIPCVVYPAPERGEVPPPESNEGRTRGSTQGRGDEDFAGLRRYRPGDPLRRVAWKATTTDDLQVKEFAGEAPSRVWLRWPATAGLAPEQRFARLCRWVLDAHAEGRVYGLEIPGHRIPPSSGEKHRENCLTALALCDTTTP